MTNLNKHPRRTGMDKTTSREAGFSLLELAISMIIVSILMAGVLGSYQLWIKQKREKETIDHAEAMAFAIQGFFATHGRYPCPAPLNVQRTDPAYGKEPAGPDADSTGCASTTIPIGSCSGGICVAGSGRSVTANFDGNDTTPETTASPRIRIGAVPFRDIGFDELVSLDGYDNKYLYAVTEFQASRNGIGTKPDTGGINIVDRSGNTILGTPDSADYVVLSHGEDRVGAYNFIGSISANCPASGTATLDQENCDNDATFRAADHADIAGTNHFDDIIRHEAPASSPRWAYSPGGNGNIHHLFTDGNLGGDFAYNWYQSQPHAGADYQAFQAAVGADTKLWITGDVKVEGNIKTDSYCDKERDDCFDPDMIGGDGIECPPGQIMHGISEGDAECTTGWQVACTGRQVVTGVDDQGKPTCGHIPCKASTGSAGCGGATQPLPASDHGTSVTIRGGVNNCASQTYVCTDGRWSVGSQDGFCVCPPTTQTLSCPTYCGYGGGDPQTQTGTDNCATCQYPSNWVTTSSCPATADCPPPVDTSSTSTSTSTSTSSSGDTSTSTSSSGDTSTSTSSSGGGSSTSSTGTSSSTSSTSSSSTSSSGTTSSTSTSGSSGGPTSSSGMGSSSGGGHI